MPTTKKLGLYADRKEKIKRILNSALAREGLTGEMLDRKKIICESTLSKRKHHADTIRLGELWRLDELVKFTDAELLQMFGRGNQ